MGNHIKEQVEQIEIPEELSDRVQSGVEQAKTETGENNLENPLSNKGMSKIRKRLTYFISAAVLLIGLLLGTATVSPAMAAVVSKLPLLGDIFEQKPLLEMVEDALQENEYNTATMNFGISYQPEKVITVGIKGTEEYYNGVEQGVTDTVKNLLHDKGYNAFNIKITKHQERTDYVLSDSENEEKTWMESKVTDALTQHHFKFDFVFVDPTEPTIRVNVGESEDYYQKVSDKIKQVALNVAKESKYTGYKAIISNTTVVVSKPDPGSKIVPMFADELMGKKEYHVTGVAYKEEPLTFIIRTSVASSDPSANEFGKNMEKIIRDFIESDEIEPIIDDTPYKIIVNSNDEEKLN